MVEGCPYSTWCLWAEVLLSQMHATMGFADAARGGNAVLPYERERGGLIYFVHLFVGEGEHQLTPEQPPHGGR